MLNLRRILRLFIPIIFFLLMAGLIFYITSFHIVKTNPSSSSITTADTTIDIYFNKAITGTGLQVSSQPDNVSSFKLIQPKILRVTWATPLLAGKKYSVKISGIQLANGKTYTKALAVKPKALSFDNLTDKQKSTVVNSQDNNQISDSIYKILPHYESSYRLDAKPNGNSTPQIIFTYLPPPPDMLNSSPDKSTALNLAKQWLVGQGVSLQKYQIIDYDTGQPI